MDAKAGQVSTEYTLLIGALLLVLIVILVVMMGQYAQMSAAAQERLAEHSLATLASAAQEVWMGGAGAQAKVLVDLPSNFEPTMSRISGRTIQIYLSGWGDVSVRTPFNVSGYWPTHGGKFYASVYNNNTTVAIYPAGGLWVNVSGIYANFSDGSEVSVRLQIVNGGNVSYTLTQTLTCPSGISCDYNGANGVLASGASQTPELELESNIPGLTSGRLVIRGVPQAGSEFLTEEIIIPITVRVDG